MATLREWNTNITATSEIISTVGTTALTVGFILTACQVIATSTALLMLPWLIPAVCVGITISKIVYALALVEKKQSVSAIFAIMETILGGLITVAGFRVSTPAYAAKYGSTTGVISICIMLGIFALEDATFEYLYLQKIKKDIAQSRTVLNPQVAATIADRKEVFLLSLIRGISWFIVAAAIALSAPVFMGAGLAAITGTHFYSNRAPLFFRERRTDTPGNNSEDNAITLPFVKRMELRTKLLLCPL